VEADRRISLQLLIVPIGVWRATSSAHAMGASRHQLHIAGLIEINAGACGLGIMA